MMNPVNLTLVFLLIGWSEMKKFLVETEDKAAEYGSQYSGYDYYGGQYSDYNGGRYIYGHLGLNQMLTNVRYLINKI